MAASSTLNISLNVGGGLQRFFLFIFLIFFIFCIFHSCSKSILSPGAYISYVYSHYCDKHNPTLSLHFIPTTSINISIPLFGTSFLLLVSSHSFQYPTTTTHGHTMSSQSTKGSDVCKIQWLVWYSLRWKVVVG